MCELKGRREGRNKWNTERLTLNVIQRKNETNFAKKINTQNNETFRWQQVKITKLTIVDTFSGGRMFENFLRFYPAKIDHICLRRNKRLVHLCLCIVRWIKSFFSSGLKARIPNCKVPRSISLWFEWILLKLIKTVHWTNNLNRELGLSISFKIIQPESNLTEIGNIHCEWNKKKLIGSLKK